MAQSDADGETGVFLPILGTTGGGDQLLIVSQQERLDLARSFELMAINFGENVRAPLVAEFRFNPAGPEFLFMVNHLYCSYIEHRHALARLLNTWARQQTPPVIAAGDALFDGDVQNGDTVHDRGDDLLTAEGLFVWDQPARALTWASMGSPVIGRSIGGRSSS